MGGRLSGFALLLLFCREGTVEDLPAAIRIAHPQDRPTVGGKVSFLQPFPPYKQGGSLNLPPIRAGSTTVEVSADPNPTVYQRQGTVTVAGETFTVNQAGLGSSVSDPDTIFGTDGGSAWVDITTEGNAQWVAESQVSWLTVAIGGSGSGAGSVFIVADPYSQTSSSRIGAVSLA